MVVMIDDVNIAVRLSVALILGGIIGFEREHRGKPAGLKTHILVSVGSCLIAIMSINLYVAVEGLTNADPARLAAQVVSGIGFLGAGAIIKEGSTIRGLTTAASLWVVASVGLAAGSGIMSGAIATTFLVMIVLRWLPKLEPLLHRTPGEAVLYITIDNQPGLIAVIVARLTDFPLRIIQLQVEARGNDLTIVMITLETGAEVALIAVIAELSVIDGVHSVVQEVE